jgi:NAD(P)-dependent dehydrogenase (short-subunit alcohol dehydrogenase family)
VAPTQLLAGRVALVTGGGRGLGAAIARAYAEHGAAGCLCDLDEESAREGAPEGWHALAADVTVEAQVEAAVAETVRRFGRLDALVANAGIVPVWRETGDLDLGDEWERVFAVNVRGAAATIKHALPALRERGGAIVVMASLNAWRAHPRQGLYTSSKHAVLGLARSAALDLGRFGIRVNALAPGPIATDALLGRMAYRAERGGLPVEEALEQAAAETALGRMATEEDVAGAAVFLASDLSAGITGAVLPIDAGLG